MTALVPSRDRGGVPGGHGSPAAGMFLVVSAGKRTCALDAQRVAEIVLPRPTAPVPMAGRSIHGAVFFRGECVTVFDLGCALTGVSTAGGRSVRIVVLREPRWAGLLVGAVLGLVSGPEEPAPDGPEIQPRDRSWATGVVRWNHHPVGVLDIDRVVAPEPLSAERTPGPARNL